MSPPSSLEITEVACCKRRLLVPQEAVAIDRRLGLICLGFGRLASGQRCGNPKFKYDHVLRGGGGGGGVFSVVARSAA